MSNDEVAVARDDGDLDPRECQPIDQLVGQRLRLRRLTLGMSQEQLATLVGVTFQQIQKYEKAANRISASRLYRFAQALGCTVEFFFLDLPSTSIEPDIGNNELGSVAISRESFNLLTAFNRIDEPKLRRAVLGVVTSMAPEPVDKLTN